MTRYFLALVLLTVAPALAQTVNNDGSLSYAYPIPLPAARGRFQPALALLYRSSEQGDGAAGVGWHLNLSYIEQATRASLDTNGASRTQYYLTLGGGLRRALATNPGGGFRPDVDGGYTLVTGGGSRFTMTDGLGTRYFFDQLATSAGWPTSTPNRWYLTNVQDAFGNQASFTYAAESAAQVGAILSGIYYDNYSQAGCTPTFGNQCWAHAATLTYTTNLNPLRQVVSGALVSHSSLLSSVAVSGVGGNYSYSLTYDPELSCTPPSATCGRSLLYSIRRLGKNGNTIPSDLGTLFSYQPPQPFWEQQYGAYQTLSLGGSTSLMPVCYDMELSPYTCGMLDAGLWVDLDGDGRPDVVWADPTASPPGLRWSRNVSTPGNAQFSDVEVVPGTAGWSVAITSRQPLRSHARLADIDGDGMLDLIYDAPSSQCPAGQFGFAHNSRDVTSSRAGLPSFETMSCLNATPALVDWQATQGSGTPLQLSSANLLFKDIDGDGVADLVILTSSASHVHRGYWNGAQWTVQSAYLSYPRSASSNDWTDVNGDGLPDLSGYFNLGNGATPSGWAWSAGTLLSLSPHPFTDFVGSTSVKRNLGTAFAAAESPSIVPNLDLDGDGYPDWVSGTTWQPAIPNSMESVLTSIRYGRGGGVTVSYSSRPKSATVPEPAWVVSQISGPSTLSFFYSNMQAPAPSWDDPRRMEQFGFADTWVQDQATLLVTHTHWGSDHLTAHVPLVTEQATSVALTRAPDSVVPFQRTTQTFQAHPVGGGACVPTPSYAVPVIRVATSVSTYFENQAAPSASVAVDCSQVDDFGNAPLATVSGDNNYIAHSSFPVGGGVLCKNCPTETWVTDPAGSTQLSHRWFHYDAQPGSTVSLPQGTVTNGLLNYVEEQVDTATPPTTEIARSTAYNANGTVSYTRKDYPQPYSDVQWVRDAVTYDGTGTLVTQVVRSDSNYGGPPSTSLVLTSRSYDANGLLLAESGPFPAGQAPITGTSYYDPATLYLYDEWGRPTWTGRSDNTGTYPVAAYSYNAATTTYSFASRLDWFTATTAPPPTRDDVNVSTTYYDTYGRFLQTRTRLGTGVAAPAAAQITQPLSNGKWLVSGAVIYDSAGRVMERLDPYYSTSSALADYWEGSELATPGLHATSFSYDSRSRVTCELYQLAPPTPQGVATNTPCLSSASGVAKGFSYTTSGNPERSPHLG